MGLRGGRQPGHGQLNHVNLGFLGLTPSVHEEGDLLVELPPLLGFVAQDNLPLIIVTISLRIWTDTRCSLLTRAVFSLSSNRSSWASKSDDF